MSKGRRRNLRPEDYKALADRGLTKAEAADVLGRHRKSVEYMERTHGITFAKGRPGRPRRQDRGE